MGVAAALTFGLMLTGSVEAGILVVLLVVVLVGLALVWTTGWQARRATVLGLDASRRWVTIAGVHPAFAAACEQWEKDREQAQRR